MLKDLQTNTTVLDYVDFFKKSCQAKVHMREVTFKSIKKNFTKKNENDNRINVYALHLTPKFLF